MDKIENLPDLSKLTPFYPMFAVKVLVGSTYPERKRRGLFLNLVKSVDQAVFAYDLARNRLLNPVDYRSLTKSKPELADLIFLDRMDDFAKSNMLLEWCITSTHAAINIVLGYGKSFLKFPNKRDKKRLEHLQKKIRIVRDAIVHIEKDIRKEMITEEQPFILFAHSKSVEIGQHKLTYADLANALRILHAISRHNTLTPFNQV